MPYASPTRPSMALGLLKAILAEGGITASVAYANLWFAESVGLRRYSLCASNLPIVFLAGEWTFAGAAFHDDPRRAERDAEYLRQVRQASDGYPQVWSGARGGEFTADLLALRAAAPTARPSWARPPTGAFRGWTTWCPARRTAWSRSCAGWR
jgi:hypothetical protein